MPGTPAAQHSSEDHRSQSVRVADIGPQLRRKLAPGPVALMLALTACAAGGDADQGEGAPSPEAGESQPTSVGEVSTEMTDPGGQRRGTRDVHRYHSLVAVPKVEDLLDGDGTSLIIDEAPDNMRHIPSRYAPEGPDEETRSGGDAGARIVCCAIGP